MAIVNRSFSVNVTPGMMPPIVHVSEYDVGRAYTVGILDEQGNIFTIPNGTTATIEGTLNGSVGFTQSATISNNQVSFTLSESMTAYSGKAWCKIKLVQNSQPIQTCAFVLAVDRAGVEADTVIGASGFEEQIQDAVDDYLDNHGGGVLPSGGQNGQALVSNGQGGAVWGVAPFALPSGGQSGQALLSDGAGGAVWGTQQSSGSGLTEEVKQALLDCFENVAWANDEGQTHYQALYDALYPAAPPASLVRISAVFNQGQHVIYETDSLNSLKPYLTVTAHYSDGSTQTVTNYTLSGTLTVGTSTIIVSYRDKTTTFTVAVSASRIPAEYQAVDYIESTGTQYIETGIVVGSQNIKVNLRYYKSEQATAEEAIVGGDIAGMASAPFEIGFSSTANRLFAFSSSSAAIIDPIVNGNINNLEVEFKESSPYATMNLSNGSTTLTAEKTTVNSSSISSSTINLFETGNGIAKAKVRLYSISIYGNDDTPVFDGIPCYLKSTGTIGIYDTVSERFFTNNGSGVFLKGGDI